MSDCQWIANPCHPIAEFLKNMSASADVLAMAKVEVDLNAIPEGKNVIIKWRGKPVFIRHRTQGEIDEANKIDVKSLRDPEADEDRVQKPEWLVMLGMSYPNFLGTICAFSRGYTSKTRSYALPR